jgi:hypothetical protein
VKRLLIGTDSINPDDEVSDAETIVNSAVGFLKNDLVGHEFDR